MDGHHIIWEGTLPSVDGAVDLSFDAGKFLFSQTFGLAIELNCTEGEPCVEDGDTVNTVVTAVAASDGLVSAVMISTTVESLVSCEHSTVWVEPDVVPISTTIRVHFFAKDVDKLPVRFTRAEINLVFAGRRIAVEWSRGSNEYVADVPAELTGKPGLYDLVMSVSNAWNRTAGQAASCELLRRTVIVQEGLNTQWILAGAAATAVVVIGGLVILVRKRGAHLQAIMVMLVAEAGQLVFAIFTALANLITDCIVFRQLLRGELKAPTEAYTAAYATLLSFAVVATVVSMAYRITNARLVQTQVRQIAPQGHVLAAKEAHRLVQQHEWELAQTHRSKVTLLLSLLSVAAQGGPASAKLVRASAKLIGRRALQICPCPS